MEQKQIALLARKGRGGGYVLVHFFADQGSSSVRTGESHGWRKEKKTKEPNTNNYYQTPAQTKEINFNITGSYT